MQDLRDVLLDLLGTDRREVVYIPYGIFSEPFRATPTWIYTPPITTGRPLSDVDYETITVSNTANLPL